MGWIYRRKKRDPETKQLKETGPWWIGYHVNGHPVRESTEGMTKTEAERLLKEREGRVVTGQPIIRHADRLRYDEIADDLRRHYETTGERGLHEADDRLKPLARFFNGRRVVSIDGTLASVYIQKRKADGVSNRTINLELAMLIKMLKFAQEHDKLVRLPVIHKLKEAAPRKGFFEDHQFDAVRKRLPVDLQVAVSIAHAFGWRMQSEILTLTRSQVDLEANTLRLEPGTTKNEDGRTAYLTPELRTMLAEQITRVKKLAKARGQVIPHLFPHLSGKREGQRIHDFHTRWVALCKKVGLPGMLVHDFRRTAVRNMVNRGVPERVAMTITGHRTRSIFDRYHIVSMQDLEAAALKMTGAPTGTKTGTLGDLEPKTTGSKIVTG